MSIMCGFREESRGTGGGKHAGWPLGQIDLCEDELVAYPPIFARWWGIHVPYGDIESVTRESGLLFKRLRLHRRPAAGGDVVIITLGQGCSEIIGLLNDRQVPVAAR